MELCYPHDIPRVGIVQTYRRSRMVPCIAGLICAGVSGYCTYHILTQDGPGQLWLVAGLFGLIALLMIPIARKAFRPSNWLLRVATDGVYLKFRSYLNHHFEDDAKTVVFIPNAEIASVIRLRERITLPEGKNKTKTKTTSFVDLRLTHDQTDALRDALAAERRREGPQGVTGKTTYRDYPVRVIGSDLVRIEWAVTPGALKAVELLAKEEGTESDPLLDVIYKRDWKDMSDSRQDAYIVELCERGNLIKARSLIRTRDGLSLGEAKDYVNRILQGESASSSI